MRSLQRLFSKCSQYNISATRLRNGVAQEFSTAGALKTYSRTEISIPVPIVRGHLAAQLWEQPQKDGSFTATPIIALHGYQDASSSFDPLIPLIIKDGMRIIAVDLPGHGLSSHVAGSALDFTIDAIGTIHRIMRFYKWEKVTLLGHSFGSIMSFLFSTTYPDKVEKYIGIDALYPIPRDPMEQLDRTFKQLFAIEDKLTDPNKKQPSYPFEEIVKRTYKARKGTVTEEGIRILLTRGAAPDPNNPDLFRFTHDIKTNIPSPFGKFSFQQSLKIASRLKCPSCIIKGDPGEDYEPREKFMQVVDAAQKAGGDKFEFHLVKGSHHLHLNDPNSVAPIISKFLEK